MSITTTAFAADRLIASGPLPEVAAAAHAAHLAGATVLIFDDVTAQRVEVDFRGSVEEVVTRLTPAEPPRGPGRPKLGVTAREVTLLPRHWEWLASQSGGASVALRKLVEEAMRSPAAEKRAAQEAAYRFMSVMAGDRPSFEEAARALFAGDGKAFDAHAKPWPKDIRAYARKLAGPALQ
jgi:hypothetical protein